MFMEASAVIAQRQLAARNWIEQFDEIMKRQGQPEDGVSRALLVLVMDVRTSDYLAEFDPMGLKQAQLALSGSSWENFIN